MELGPKNHNGDGLLGPNSRMVVYMDPLGIRTRNPKLKEGAGTGTPGETPDSESNKGDFIIRAIRVPLMGSFA